MIEKGVLSICPAGADLERPHLLLMHDKMVHRRQTLLQKADV